MEDILTELPPPSRFFQEDLNNFEPLTPPLPLPFIEFSNPKAEMPLHPSLLVIGLSDPSLYIFHHLSPKSLIGRLILPETHHSGNTVEPSLSDKSCNIYAISDADKFILLVSVQCDITPERSHSVARVLVGEEIIPERVLILDSIQSRNFRGKLSPDETCAFKLETSAERKLADVRGCSSLMKGLHYYPSGSMIDGLPAALLARCQLRNIKGTLCISWPEYGGPVISMIKSLLQENVLSNVKLSLNGEAENQSIRFIPRKRQPMYSELYT